MRYYVCPHCLTPVGNREVAMERLDKWLRLRTATSAMELVGKGWREGSELPTIICSQCEKRVPLWDEMEKYFASLMANQSVRELQNQSEINLDIESKERVLVGEVISTVALAGQICREFSISDHGIDMEIEFKNDDGDATGKKVYLQLKSGDSYLRKRAKDNAEIFDIKKPRHAKYWMDQAFLVMLIIRNSEGEIRWMEVRDWLKEATDSGKKTVRQIVFKGERFDVMSVRRWRDRTLDEEAPQKNVNVKEKKQ